MGHWRKEHREEAKEKTDKRKEHDEDRRAGGWKKGWRGGKIKEMVKKRCKRLEIDTEI